jgi:phage shock protein A
VATLSVQGNFKQREPRIIEQEEHMSLWSRFVNLFRMRASAALDKAEEPGQVMDYSYGKQLEQLQQLRRSIAEVVTNEKRLDLLQSQVLQQINKLDQQAMQALQVNREDLARMALQRKEGLVAQISSYEQQIAQLRAQEENLIAMERKISARVEAFRTQKEMVKAQYNAAQAQVKINEAVTGISQEMQEMNLAMQRAQDKVLTMQSRANAMETLIEQGTLSEQGMLGSGSGDTLDRELQKISSQQNVEAQLQAMKQRLQLGGANAQQPQIEGPTSDQ